MPVLAVDGTADRIQRYDGWLYPTGRLLSVAETMEFWRLQHGCSGQKATLLPHRLAADATRVELAEWIGCRTDNVIWLYRVADGGHQVPSFTAAPESWVREAGRQNQDIETIDVGDAAVTAILQRSTCPPSAAERHCSIADITWS